MTLIFEFFSFRNRPTPLIVPPAKAETGHEVGDSPLGHPQIQAR
jgi:hypothetical protein